MNALEKYHQHTSTRNDRLNVLQEENAKIRRQIDYFGNALERAKLVGDEKAEEKAQQGLTILLGKLEESEKAIQELDIEPYAQSALQELYERRRVLEDQLHSKWQKVIKARDTFIQEFTALGEIRNASITLSHESHPVALAMRQNPITELHISGQSGLVVDLDMVNSLLRY